MRHQPYGHEGRIPIICVPLAAVAVILGVVAFVKVRPRLQKKAEKAQVKRKRVTGPPPWKRCDGIPSKEQLKRFSDRITVKFDRITEGINQGRFNAHRQVVEVLW